MQIRRFKPFSSAAAVAALLAALATPALVFAESFSDPIKLQPRDQYLQDLKHHGLKSICSDIGMMKCLRINENACRITYATSFDVCLKRVKIPQEVSLIYDDQMISENMGECIGREFGHKHLKNFNWNSKCARRE